MKNTNAIAWCCVLLLVLAISLTSCKEKEETTMDETTIETTVDTTTVMPDETMMPADTTTMMPAEQ